MQFLALGAVALLLVLWASRQPVFKRRAWRLGSAASALAAFTGAAYAAVRESWAAAIVLLVMGLWFAASVRSGGTAPKSASSRMSADDARSVLGLGPDAGPEEIKAAYTRLMRMAHPDKGGTSGLAAQLNAARDRLLRG